MIPQDWPATLKWVSMRQPGNIHTSHTLITLSQCVCSCLICPVYLCSCQADTLLLQHYMLHQTQLPWLLAGSSPWRLCWAQRAPPPTASPLAP